MGTTNYGDDPDGAGRRTIGDTARAHGMTYPTYLDRRAAWARRTGLHVRPAFLLIDRQGRVAYRFVGPLEVRTPSFDALAAEIERALGDAGALGARPVGASDQ